MSFAHDQQLLVFTDLDGSLLDHHSYSYQAALPRLQQLEQLGVPVIPATSKTRAEIVHLRESWIIGTRSLWKMARRCLFLRGIFSSSHRIL